MLLNRIDILKLIPKIGRFAVSQVFIQALTAFCGILIIRNLTKSEYSILTIIYACLFAAFVLADSSISGSVSAMSGRNHDDKSEISKIIKSALKLRIKISFFVNIPLISIMFYLILRQGVDVFAALMLCFVSIFALIIQLNTDIFRVVLRILGEYEKIQIIDIILVVLRLLLTIIVCLLFKNAICVVVINLILYFSEYLLIKNLIQRFINKAMVSSDKYEEEIWANFKKQFIPTLFYAIQGNIIVFTVSWIGKTNVVAEIFAIGRISLVFELIKSIYINMYLPRFVIMKNRKKMHKMYFNLIGIYVLISAFLLALAAVLNKQVLFILGNRYSNLNVEVILSLIAGSLGSIGAIMSSINQARAWFDYSWLYIPFSVIAIVAGILTLDLSNALGASVFSIFCTLPVIFSNIIRTNLGFRHMKDVVDVEGE